MNRITNDDEGGLSMNDNALVTRNEQSPEMGSQLPVVAPAVDILESDSEILLCADLPGVQKDDIAIHIDNGKMTLAGVRRLRTGGAVTWQECGDLEYRRTFAVPQSIDVDKVHADLIDGVLQLHLPKSEAAKPRQIEITVG